MEDEQQIIQLSSTNQYLNQSSIQQASDSLNYSQESDKKEDNNEQQNKIQYSQVFDFPQFPQNDIIITAEKIELKLPKERMFTVCDILRCRAPQLICCTRCCGCINVITCGCGVILAPLLGCRKCGKQDNKNIVIGGLISFLLNFFIYGIIVNIVIAVKWCQQDLNFIDFS